MPVRPDATLALPNGPPLTYDAATRTDRNILQETQNVAETEALEDILWANRAVIKALVKHHLGGLEGDCEITVEPPRRWIIGNFNVCIPVEVETPATCRLLLGTSWLLPGTSRLLILRCALPHKLAESHNPGSVDEKMACEVGAYAWIEKNCPDIRIPHLYGFGFSDQRQFTHQEHRPWYLRGFHKVRRFVHDLLRRPALLSPYIPHEAFYCLPTAYMLLEDVSSDDSYVLSKRANIHHQRNPVLKENLYKGLSRILLSLSRVPQPKIGSLRFGDDGTVTLTNRPLTRTVMNFENEGTPVIVPRDTTYASTQAFVADMFDFHDNRFAHHPTVTSDAEDCRGEMAARVLMRALAPWFVRPDREDGPFALQLDGIRASNIFVDDDWNVTALIDLEWLCALPVENLAVPFWLVDCAVVDIEDGDQDTFNQAREEFMHVFEEEERRMTGGQRGAPTARIMREGWASGVVWFWHGLMSTNGMLCAFTDHICPRFSPPLTLGAERFLSRFWTTNADAVVNAKLNQRRGYLLELERLYEASEEESS